MRGIVHYASPDHSAAERAGLHRQCLPSCSRCVTDGGRDLLPLDEGIWRRVPTARARTATRPCDYRVRRLDGKVRWISSIS